MSSPYGAEFLSYRDIRNIETDLLHKTKLLESSYLIDHSPDIPVGDINPITQLINETLTAKNMRARFINPQFSDQAPDTTMAQMFSQARASRRNRIRFTTGLGSDPTLTLVTPILENNTVEQFISFISRVNYLVRFDDN